MPPPPVSLEMKAGKTSDGVSKCQLLFQASVCVHVSVSTTYCSWSSLGRLSVPPWLLVIGASQTSVAVHCFSNLSDQLLCRLIVSILASGISTLRFELLKTVRPGHAA